MTEHPFNNDRSTFKNKQQILVMSFMANAVQNRETCRLPAGCVVSYDNLTIAFAWPLRTTHTSMINYDIIALIHFHFLKKNNCINFLLRTRRVLREFTLSGGSMRQLCTMRFNNGSFLGLSLVEPVDVTPMSLHWPDLRYVSGSCMTNWLECRLQKNGHLCCQTRLSSCQMCNLGLLHSP